MKFTVELDAKQDERLRKEIRAMIEGQIKSIARGEAAQIIIDEMMTKAKSKVGFEDMIRAAITNRVNEFFSASQVRQLIIEAIPDLLRAKVTEAKNRDGSQMTADDFLKDLFLQEFQRMMYISTTKK